MWGKAFRVGGRIVSVGKVREAFLKPVVNKLVLNIVTARLSHYNCGMLRAAVHMEARTEAKVQVEYNRSDGTSLK